MIRDRETSLPRGFGFGGTPGEKEARAAMKALGGVGLRGRALTFSRARPIDSRPDYRT